jgi:hypothetical protein
MYLVVGTGMLSSLVLAVLLTTVARASVGIAAAIPIVMTLPAVAGAAGAQWGMSSALLAVAHASPKDRLIILFGSANEALQNSMFGAAMSGGLAIAVGLGLFVGWISRANDAAPAARQTLLAGTVVALAFATVCFVGAASIREQADACSAIANQGPSMQDFVRTMVLRLSGLQRAWTASLFAALVTLIVGAVVVRARVGGRLLFGASALLGLGLLGLGTRANAPGDIKGLSSEELSEPALLRFDAPPLDGSGLFIGDETTLGHVRTAYGEWRDLHEYAGDPSSTFGLLLGQALNGETLAAVLEVLCEEGASGVNLFTAPTTKPVSDLPAPYDAIRPLARGVRIGLGLQSEHCPDDCGLALLANGTLSFGTEKWPLEERADVDVPVKGEPVILAIEPRPPQELLRAAITAMKHEAPLMLLSAHQREPVKVDVQPKP